MEDQNKSYVDIAKNFTQQAQLTDNKSVSFVEDKISDFSTNPDYSNTCGNIL